MLKLSGILGIHLHLSLNNLDKDISMIEDLELEECISFIWYSDKPRKAGGGKGNVGNVKDDLNQDKYIKEGEENNAE